MAGKAGRSSFSIDCLLYSNSSLPSPLGEETKCDRRSSSIPSIQRSVLPTKPAIGAQVVHGGDRTESQARSPRKRQSESSKKSSEARRTKADPQDTHTQSNSRPLPQGSAHKHPSILRISSHSTHKMKEGVNCITESLFRQATRDRGSSLSCRTRPSVSKIESTQRTTSTPDSFTKIAATTKGKHVAQAVWFPPCLDSCSEQLSNSILDSSQSSLKLLSGPSTTLPITQATVLPTAPPTAPSTASSTALPTAPPTASSTAPPTALPTTPSTAPSTALPTTPPTTPSTALPTAPPTASSTAPPTALPTTPSTAPSTALPTAPPTAPSTALPTAPPTASSTAPPTALPTAPPTASSTAPPTALPTTPPTAPSTALPTAPPTASSTAPPTALPTTPSTAPSTALPTPPSTAPPTALPTTPSTALPTAPSTALPTAPPTAPPTAWFTTPFTALPASSSAVPSTALLPTPPAPPTAPPTAQPTSPLPEPPINPLPISPTAPPPVSPTVPSLAPPPDLPIAPPTVLPPAPSASGITPFSIDDMLGNSSKQTTSAAGSPDGIHQSLTNRCGPPDSLTFTPHKHKHTSPPSAVGGGANATPMKLAGSSNGACNSPWLLSDWLPQNYDHLLVYSPMATPSLLSPTFPTYLSPFTPFSPSQFLNVAEPMKYPHSKPESQRLHVPTGMERMAVNEDTYRARSCGVQPIHKPSPVRKSPPACSKQMDKKAKRHSPLLDTISPMTSVTEGISPLNPLHTSTDVGATHAEGAPVVQGACPEYAPSYNLLLKQMEQLVDLQKIYTQYVTNSNSGTFPPVHQPTCTQYADDLPGDQVLLSNSTMYSGLSNPSVHHDNCRHGYCPHIAEQVKRREKRHKRTKSSSTSSKTSKKRNYRLEVKSRIQESIQKLCKKRKGCSFEEESKTLPSSQQQFLVKRARELLHRYS